MRSVIPATPDVDPVYGRGVMACPTCGHEAGAVTHTWKNLFRGVLRLSPALPSCADSDPGWDPMVMAEFECKCTDAYHGSYR